MFINLKLHSETECKSFQFLQKNVNLTLPGCTTSFLCFNTAKFVFFFSMRYVAAYLLTSLGGKEDPTSQDIEKVLSSVGIESDAEKLKKVISELKGKNLDELIEKGREKLASVPCGGGVATASASAAPAAAAPEAEKKEEKKVEEKKEESESDDDMGFGLFD